MKFEARKYTDKEGQTIVVRSAEPTDAKILIKYMKDVASETDNLLREPEEVDMTEESEATFLRNMIESERDIMLTAFTEAGKLIGVCSINGIGDKKRILHRCDLAIALYRKYCGRGIGNILMSVLLDAAKSAGYEQAELEVVSTNKNAIMLYEKHGFEKTGSHPRAMKYADGSYADFDIMVKEI